MYKVINDGKNSVVFFTPDEAKQLIACREVDEETIKDDKKLQEILNKKEYRLL